MEQALQPVLDRQNAVLRCVSPHVPAQAVSELSAPFDEKLAEVMGLLRTCEELQKKKDGLDVADSDNQNQLIDLLKALGISALVPSAAPAAVAAPAPVAEPASVVQPVPEVNAREQPEAIVKAVTADEFNAIPKYMRGRMNCTDINTVVSCLDEYLVKKRRLLNAPFKRLNQHDKNEVIKWKEEETSKTGSTLFCIESELRSLVPDKLRVQLKSVLPCLRHLGRIKEVRDKGKIFLMPLNCAPRH